VKAPTCRFCGSANVIKAGKRYNLNSTKQRWKCKACGKRSVEDDGFLHLWYDKWSVTESIDLYHEGLSTRKVERHLRRHHHRRPSWTTIWRWIHRFAKQVKRFVARLAPKLSGEWQADEMHLREGGKDGWNWEVMDAGTRFWLASALTEGWERTERQAEAVLNLAREQAKERPKKLTTDGLPAYEHGRVWALGWRECEHERCVSWREGKGPTNLIERKIQTTRMRTKTMRCLKNWEKGQDWLDGARIHYNFVRIHMTLKKTPAEAAGLNLRLGRNPWLGLISLSAA